MHHNRWTDDWDEGRGRMRRPVSRALDRQEARGHLNEILRECRAVLTRSQGEMAPRERGLVVNFMADRGYGFIRRHDGSSAFVHQRNIEMDGFRALVPGQWVEFSPVHSPKGPWAAKVTILETP